MVVHWSTKRAKKDAHQRAQQVAKLRKKCQRHRQPEAFSHHGDMVVFCVLLDLDTQKRYAVPSAPSVHAKGIYQTLDLKIRTQPFEIN